MIKEISEVVKNLVYGVDNTITGKYDINTGRTFVCETKWIRIGKIVADSQGREFLISAVENDEYVVASSLIGNVNLDGIIYLSIPYWLTGTKISANREWTIADNNLIEKTPIVWLLELIKYKNLGKESSIEFETQLRLFILDETNVTNFYVADHRLQVVLPMENLADEIIKHINTQRNFKTIYEYEIISFSRFGTEDENGMMKNILDANLSGVELSFKLVKYKQNCRC